jgi:hypothetical protein
MQSQSDDTFQIATLVVGTLIAVVIIFYLIVFINPRVAFNPFKPPTTPTAVALAPTLPPTWTPTSSPTQTWTPTVTPTFTPPSTATSIPTRPPTAVPSATPRPPTRTPAPISSPPTPIPSRYAYRAVFQCEHSGGIYVKGNAIGGGEGLRVRLATSADPAAVIDGGEQYLKVQPDGKWGYSFTLKAIGAFDTVATWYIWLVDGAGNPVSDPNFHFQTNNFPPDNPLACWQAFIDFVR